MSFQLKIVSGLDAGKTFAIPTAGNVVVGRGENATLKLADQTVSRSQFQLSISGDAVTLVDAGSRFGTQVNNQKVAKIKLNTGDVINAGETSLRFEATTSATQTLAPTSARTPSVDHSDDPWRNIRMKQELSGMVGKCFLHYDLLKVLSEANTGVVFLAQDNKRNEQVALKIFSPEFLSRDKDFERFVRAMKTMLPLKHPNIVRLLHAGKSSGLCYMVSEYIEGDSVADLIERIGVVGMLDWQNTLKTAIDVAEALCFAEQNNIVHRNITPKNILIRESDNRALLGDLMFAKALEGPASKEITVAGELVGALSYMSPEQTLGGEIDCRSDIYCLGAALYGMLTGKPPAEGRNAAVIVVKIQTEMPQNASEIQMSVPPLFNDVVMGMLTKAPNGRPESAFKLLEDLKRVAKFQGITL